MMNAWKAIKDAPRDGTEILVYVADWDTCAVATWISVGHYHHWADRDGSVGDDENVTHWMPLPARPTK
jgi:hypothetical protein